MCDTCQPIRVMMTIQAHGYDDTMAEFDLHEAEENPPMEELAPEVETSAPMEMDA